MKHARALFMHNHLLVISRIDAPFPQRLEETCAITYTCLEVVLYNYMASENP